MLDAVLAYARLGWAVFPLIPGGKRPAVPSWKTAATTNETTIRQWWSHRPYNIGIACGPSNLLVVDCDEKGDGGGLAAWYQLGSTYSDPISTYTVLTASRPFPGEHWYFAVTDGLQLKNSASEIAPRVDIKCGWGYVVAPPSVINGIAYEADKAGALAPAPGWLLELVKRSARRHTRVEERTPTERSLRRGLGVLLKARTEIEATYEGCNCRNSTLYRKTKACAGLIPTGLLTEEMIWEHLRPAALSTGLDESGVDSTIRSGLRNGIAEPWDPDGH